ncbi:MAG: leucine--tRNA ligase [Planctomycetota bacterium]|nr:leucine--tRNA ligase [Planctomycetota bacterium]
MEKRQYDFKAIEPKWQQYWLKNKLFECDLESDKPKFYSLVMFPYPSGDLHVGHGRNYILGDAVVRYKTMQGVNVLSPMGWDAFGLPAENAAVKNGIHPGEWTMKNIERMRQQIMSWGAAYDWTREVATCHPKYYKWTQWLFLQLFNAGLAYRKRAPVNWCPVCTTLANEEVADGRCVRCESEVTLRHLDQWFLKITKYADRLVDDLDTLENWPERILLMQENWIGRSEGAEIHFPVEPTGESLTCFTTRPDTIYGVTFLALAPEHPAVEKLCAKGAQREKIREFVEKVCEKTAEERTGAGAEKVGVFTGKMALNPLNEERVPIWVTNYVLKEYGTGAVMGVPAHDQRDFEFARKNGIPVRAVIQPPGEALDGATMSAAYEGDGVQVNSGEFSGLPNRFAMAKIIEAMEERGVGSRKTTYKLHDWLISRQRYWGAPIPIVHCPDCGPVAVPDKKLPVLLPEITELKPSGKSPLAMIDSFVKTTCPKCKKPATRDTDTLAQWLCSCWYFLRYLSPRDDKRPFNVEVLDRWMPVDQYIGGAEHAVLHLLYTRFVIKALFDLGLVNFEEPFAALFNQGTITKISSMTGKLEKMSKSRGNVVPPDPLVEQYGADTVRLYTLFIGPPEKDAEWIDDGIIGPHRFLFRLWEAVAQNVERLEGVPLPGKSAADTSPTVKDLRRKTHATIKNVTDDIDGDFHFNTSISSVMELVNEVYGLGPFDKLDKKSLPALREALEAAVLLMAPMVPHISEELWTMLGHEPSVLKVRWPKHNPELLKVEAVELVVQVNGKLRGRVNAPAGASEDDVKKLAMACETVKKFLGDARIIDTIVVPGRLVNIVTESKDQGKTETSEPK